MLQTKVVKQHKKYQNQYVLIDNQIYTKNEVEAWFDNENLEHNVSEENKKKTIKPNRYPKSKKMQTQITLQKEKLFDGLKLQKAKTNYDNLKLTQPLLRYFLHDINYNAMVVENRLFSLKNKTFELKQSQKQLTKAVEKKVYSKEKEFKKTKQLLKQIEQQTKLQNKKMLYDVLINKKTANSNDAYSFMYLLNKLNVAAYQLVLTHKKTNATYHLVLVPSKKASKDTVKYHILDLTKARREQLHKIKEENEVEFYTKDYFQKEYYNYEPKRLENLKQTILPNTPEWNKVWKHLATETIKITS
jgi:hypothetical protein